MSTIPDEPEDGAIVADRHVDVAFMRDDEAAANNGDGESHWYKLTSEEVVDATWDEVLAELGDEIVRLRPEPLDGAS